MAKTIFTDQKGRIVLVPRDDQNRPTPNWDSAAGVSWTPSEPTSIEIVDEDVDPLDAEIRPLLAMPGVMQTIGVRFDGRVGEDENLINLMSEEFEVLEPPPGEAVGGTVEIEVHPVE